MEPLTFDQLPQAISQLHERLSNIEQLLLQANHHPPETDELLTITQAAKFLNLAVPTIYSKVSQGIIPVNKQGKRLYFYKSELADWVKAGRKKTISEIRQEVDQSFIPKKRVNR